MGSSIESPLTAGDDQVVGILKVVLRMNLVRSDCFVNKSFLAYYPRRRIVYTGQPPLLTLFTNQQSQRKQVMPAGPNQKAIQALQFGLVEDRGGVKGLL